MDLLGLRPVSLATLRWLRWRLSESVSWPWRHAVFQGACPPRLALSSRLVLTTTGILFVAGAIMFIASESGGVLRSSGIGQKWLTSAFASITARTAGFQTVEATSFAGPTLLATMLLMVVGASPLSTGGGVKTSTLAVAALTLRAMTRDRDQVEAFGRSIPSQVVNACVAITALYALAAMLVTTALLATQARRGVTYSPVGAKVVVIRAPGIDMDCGVWLWGLAVGSGCGIWREGTSVRQTLVRQTVVRQTVVRCQARPAVASRAPR
jgi:Trk-type K+ transport system membrane component